MGVLRPVLRLAIIIIFIIVVVVVLPADVVDANPEALAIIMLLQ